MSPAQFWKMPPPTVWWLVEAKRPRRTPLPESDMADLHAFMVKEGHLDG